MLVENNTHTHTPRRYDLLTNVKHGTPISVGVSILLAIIVVCISTQTLRLCVLAAIAIIGVVLSTIAFVAIMGWRISLVESTIIILTVGLAFDFTLHYAVSFKCALVDVVLDDKTADLKTHLLRRTLETISLPVMLSCLTTASTGFCMIWAETLCFQEIGYFMIAVSLISYAYSTLILLSLLCVSCTIEEFIKRRYRIKNNCD
jgi:predicted RND superfamily exporter protein